MSSVKTLIVHLFVQNRNENFRKTSADLWLKSGGVLNKFFRHDTCKWFMNNECRLKVYFCFARRVMAVQGWAKGGETIRPNLGEKNTPRRVFFFVITRIFKTICFSDCKRPFQIVAGIAIIIIQAFICVLILSLPSKTDAKK